MAKRSLAALAVLGLALAGCSGASDEKSSAAGAAPASGAVEPQAVGVTNDHGSDEPLRIGVVVTLTSSPGQGQDWLDGAEGTRVAQYRLDAGGGSVELEVVDDLGTPNGGIAAVEQLVDSGVSGIVMATSGSHVQAALESPAATGTAILLPYYRTDGALPDNAFRTGPTEAAIDQALLRALSDQALDKPFVLTADGVDADGVGSADALEFKGNNVDKLARRVARARTKGAIDSVVIAAPAAAQAEISSALRGRLDDLPVVLTPEATTATFASALDADAGTVASRFASAGVDATDTTTMTNSPAAASVAAYFAALRLAAGDPEATDLFGNGTFASVAGDADTASHDAVMALAAASDEAGSSDPGDVLAALTGLQVGPADGLAGPALDFSTSDALGADSVVPLLATVQDPGVRPPASGEDARIYWFAVDLGSS